MLTARRLLIGGGGSFVAPRRIFDLTSSGDGGWPGKTGAVHHGTTTYFGWVDSAGNLEMMYYTDAAASSSVFTLHATLQADWHNRPSLLVDSDGYLHAMYSKHAVDGGGLYHRRTVNSLDTDATISGGWDTETNIDSQTGGNKYTYPQILELTGEGKLWAVWRWGTSYDAAYFYSTTTDLTGATGWTAQTEIYYHSGRGAYIRIDTNGTDRIDFVLSSGTIVSDHADLYHFYYDGTWNASDGTSASLPLATTDMTLVYDGATYGVRLPFDLVVNSSSDIVAVLAAQTGTSERYVYCTWNGSSWTAQLILDDGGLNTSFVEGGIALDPADTTRVVLSRVLGSRWEMFLEVTADGGATWTETALTSASATDQFYPVAVQNAGSALTFIWLTGTHTSYTSYSLSIRGTDA